VAEKVTLQTGHEGGVKGKFPRISPGSKAATWAPTSDGSGYRPDGAIC